MANDWRVALVSLCLLLSVSACATLPSGKLVPEMEATGVRADFYDMQSRQNCRAGIDADVAVTFYGLLSSGSINGYLLTFPPADLRFEAVNPMGLTENILTTDGQNFSYLLIRQQVAYTGQLASSEAVKYITPQQAKSISSWLLGRVSAKAHIVGGVMAADNGDYWLQLTDGDSTGAVRVLFSPRQAILKRYVTEAAGAYGRLDVSYHYADSAERTGMAKCLLPDLVSIKLGGHKAVVIAIRDAYPLSKRLRKQFTVRIPATFERIDLP
jgi:hypothetical protein